MSRRPRSVCSTITCRCARSCGDGPEQEKNLGASCIPARCLYHSARARGARWGERQTDRGRLKSRKVREEEEE
eukprot:752482-Hanusia_phi.AAC.1